jgi:hypothetical protein
MPEQGESGLCPVSADPAQRHESRKEHEYYDCPHCGRFRLTRQARWNLKSTLEREPEKAMLLAHLLRRMQAGSEWPLVDEEMLEQLLATSQLPTVAEQGDNLVRWLGEQYRPGESADLTYRNHGAIIGAHSDVGFGFVVSGLSRRTLLDGPVSEGHGEGDLTAAHVMLTFEGWERYQELKMGAASGRRAFMAMPFGNPELTRIVTEFFIPAVAETGFELRRSIDHQPAGLIDEQMHVDIQAAWFLIADLTDGNQGAYWEAGYAEGLRKPVIYTCKKSVFETEGTHFDTNHRVHVLWDAENLSDAVGRLKAIIRVSIPEAKREDDG